MTTPCRARLCKNLVKSRLMKGYCDEHAHLRHGWQHNKSASERGYGSQWKRLRLQVLKRDKYLCQMCKADARYTHATDVDHIIPKAKGGTDNMVNLQSLCSSCHKIKTAQDGRGG
ncbi:HNH endonuclease [Moraxella catarrhalis]|uniref:HNH endonuclease n=1 Tax=Moraxella catarrhalis TaxID=480 RepID=UPI000202ABCA|nr:HNH endonuclease signature motif containing protein [Moraxella catarrhalis]AKI28286.1 hypothetical protein [Moraxella phage Mcat28]AKI28432.1 hypothetical protein [Moraxella phage Mcat31]EGE25874.1 HNH endonuclease [Moraxella catarrhalis CO72]MCG6832603.1 HNH endonuclease [Moraxella catarrhalis]MDE4520093.1 HNH endonuclease [Moraxella catarrhalis]